ncbi:MAG: hypothetical protein PF437_05965 [Sulfurimonas sp.]|nr:hypothetical protein [Sulfurimonas sp.]
MFATVSIYAVSVIARLVTPPTVPVLAFAVKLPRVLISVLELPPPTYAPTNVVSGISLFTTKTASKVFLNTFQPSEKANGESDLGSS